MKYIYLLIFSCLSFQCIKASEAVKTLIDKSDSGVWSVEYQLAKPAFRIAFIRNPNDARVKRWKPSSSDFIIKFVDGQEYIKRKDNERFTKATYYLEPTYTSLPKDYAPFSPFSDGGMLLHDGRFFACAEECDLDIDYRWKMELRVPRSEKIIVDGQIYQSNASWVGKNSGSKIYIGSQKPLDNQHVVALIDSQIPEKLKDSLSYNLPKIMEYFSPLLGKLDTKPSLFASYNIVNEEGTSTQGGVLPNQIFMHWSGMNLDKYVKDENFRNDMVWFFAHEVAHLFQKASSFATDRNNAWLHEGSADKFALKVLQSLNPDLKEYFQYRMDKFKSECRKGISETPLKEATKNKKFKLHYSCGFLIHHSIDRIAKNHFPEGNGIFDVWVEYNKQVQSGEEVGINTYFKVVEKYTSKSHVKLIKNFIADSANNIDKLVETF